MFNMDAATYSRILTAVTLGFHIIFATIGVSIPLMIAIAHWTGIRKNDSHYILMARRWTRGFLITVAVGVVTGTSIGLQLSLLWPSFMKIAGQVISLPLFLETFAFFLEAIFLGIYIYTWDRFTNPKRHFMLLIPVVIGSSLSAFFITTVNAFMNTPRGFTLKNGVITNIHPLVAMFNPATPTKAVHVMMSAYMTGAFILASIAAYHLLRGKTHVYYKKGLKLTMLAALIFSISTVLVGDFSGKFLAAYQPEKLAAAEWHFHTEKTAPLYVFGTLDSSHHVHNQITLPAGLSILAKDSIHGKVTGLNATPKKFWPPLTIHYLFDLMVTIGTLLMFLAIAFTLFKKIRYKRLALFPILAGGPLAMLTIELGWIFTERGRQPWILRGYMLTNDGATTSPNVGLFLILFIILYAVLAIGCIKALSKLFKKRPAEEELEEEGVKE